MERPEVCNCEQALALEKENVLLRKALSQARSHVFRQQHGRHEQDREDAQQWLTEFGPMVDEINEQRNASRVSVDP